MNIHAAYQRRTFWLDHQINSSFVGPFWLSEGMLFVVIQCCSMSVTHSRTHIHTTDKRTHRQTHAHTYTQIQYTKSRFCQLYKHAHTYRVARTPLQTHTHNMYMYTQNTYSCHQCVSGNELRSLQEVCTQYKTNSTKHINHSVYVCVYVYICLSV